MKNLRQAAKQAIEDINSHMMYRMSDDTVADALHNAVFALSEALKMESEPHACTAVSWSAETGYVFPSNVPDVFELMSHAENYRASEGGEDHWQKREIMRGACLRIVDAYREAAKTVMTQKAKPDFLEGYESGMADAKRMMLNFLTETSGLAKLN
jgi:hypothetical protein